MSYPPHTGPHRAVRRALSVLGSLTIFLGTALAQPDAPAKRIETARQLVAMIEGQLGTEATSGAGILFGYEGGNLYVATANHVVRRGELQASNLRVQLRVLPGEKLAADLMPQTMKGLDLAVLRVSGVKDSIVAKLPFRLLGDASVLNRKDEVNHIGFSGGRPWRTNVTGDPFSERINDELYFESMSVRPGDSGGGMFNARWELMGMVTNDEPPEGKALNIGRIIEQVRQWGFPVGLRYTVFHATKIAFMSNRESRGDTYVMNPDGTGQRRLTRNQTPWAWESTYKRVLNRSWSPDGKTIAFATGFPKEGKLESDYGEIYRIDADGANLVNLTNHPARDTGQCWSPDGKKIAFMSDRTSRWEIYLMNTDGTKPLALTRNTPVDVEYEFHCGWSPDSKKIAFGLYRDTSPRRTSEIHVVNADGTNQLRLARDTASARRPSWSPDGKRIAFVSRYEYSDGICVMNADGTNPVELVKPDVLFEVGHLSWSPDATKILFRANGRAQGTKIWVIQSDGSGLVQLTKTGADEPVWSPDGTMIAFAFYFDDDEAHICVMNADGTEQVCLTQNVDGGHTKNLSPSWSPFFR